MREEDLIEKIEFEWRKYHMYMRLCSNIDIISRAKEIYYKTLIHDRLLEDINRHKFTEQDIKDYISISDLIDCFYFKGCEMMKIYKDRIDDASWEMLKSAVKF